MNRAQVLSLQIWGPPYMYDIYSLLVIPVIVHLLLHLQLGLHLKHCLGRRKASGPN
jgi:hypothetical protein